MERDAPQRMDDRRQERSQHILVNSGTAVILHLMRERYTITTIDFVPDTLAQNAALDPDVLDHGHCDERAGRVTVVRTAAHGSENNRHPDAGLFHRTQLGGACPRAAVAVRKSA